MFVRSWIKALCQKNISIPGGCWTSTYNLDVVPSKLKPPKSTTSRPSTAERASISLQDTMSAIVIPFKASKTPANVAEVSRLMNDIKKER